MYSIFQIPNSPAIPFEKVIKVDPTFHDDKENKWGFSVHIGDNNKRCNFYLNSAEEATQTRDRFVKLWDEYFMKKYELVE